MLIGTKTLLYGPSGTGKTTALRTVADAGLELFCLFTDPNFDVLSDLGCDRMHYVYVAPAEMSFEALLGAAKSISQLTVEKLAEQKSADKGNYQQFYKVISACANFKCDRCGKEFGPIDKFGMERFFAVDGLSGLSIMSRDLTVGSKPTMHPGEWGIAQHTIEKLVQKWATGMRTHFALIAHIEREVDEVAGTSKLMASTLGRKLAPKLPWMFNDVILAQRDGAKFTWTNEISGVDVKPRNLAPGTHKPNFAPLIESWRKRHPELATTPASLANGEQKPQAPAQAQAKA